MNKLISALPQVQAANDQDYNPDWMSEVPDDWSHTILVSPEQPALHARYNEKGELLTSSVHQNLGKSNGNVSSEDQIHGDTRTTTDNAKAA